MRYKILVLVSLILSQIGVVVSAGIVQASGSLIISAVQITGGTGKAFEDYIIEWRERKSKDGWEKHRIWIYYPSAINSKRSYHLDGRQGIKKYTGDDISFGYTND